MKCIHKSEIVYRDGYLTDSEGEVLYLDELAEEFNEVVRLVQLTDFVLANKDAIKAASQPLVFHPLTKKAPRLSSKMEAETPLIDEEKTLIAKRAEEWLKVRGIQDINEHLAKYSHLAEWFVNEYVLYCSRDCTILPIRFDDDILRWDASQVVKVIERYHHPDVTALSGLVIIGHA